MKTLKLLPSVVFSLFACNNIHDNPSSNVRGLSKPGSSGNVALVFGASNGLPGIDLDLSNMKTVLADSSAHYNFDVTQKLDVSPEDLIATTKEFAPQVSDGGTLFWYFSGHGGGGTLLAEGGSVAFATVTKAIKSVRTKPLSRFVVFIDTCNNGDLANDPDAIKSVPASSITTDGKIDHDKLAQATADAIVDAADKDSTEGTDKLYDELFVMTSSSEYESSSAGSNGSAFTVSVAGAFSDLKNGQATLGDFAKLVKEKTVDRAGHTPQYRAAPESVLNETLLNP